MTPQDIMDKTFEKAVFGGYDMAAVDDFLNQMRDEFAALQKENATLKAKLKVLANKIEEYRGSEEAMRLALVSAQKVGSQMEAEAKAKSERMVAEAEAKAARLTRDAKLEVANEEARLVEAKRSSAQFLEAMRMICTKQLDFYDHIGEMKIIDDLPGGKADDDTVREIQKNVAKAASESASAGSGVDLSREIDKISPKDNDSGSPTRQFTPVNARSFSFDDLRYGGKEEGK